VNGTSTPRAHAWLGDHYSRQDRELIQRAIEFVQAHLPNLNYEYRASVPYLLYASELARILTEFLTYQTDSVTIAAAFIAYPMEVAVLPRAMIVDEVDYEVAYLVEQVRALRALEWRIWETGALSPRVESEQKLWTFKQDVLRRAYQSAIEWPESDGREGNRSDGTGFQKRERRQEYLIRMLLTASPDIRGLIILLADRLCLSNLLLTEPRGASDIALFARLTLDIYAPLADRLGIWSLKSHLETAAFRLLYPEEYDELVPVLAELESTSKQWLHRVGANVQEMLNTFDIPAMVTVREKHAYSIFRKMQAKKLRLDQIHDVLGIRVIILWSQERRALEDQLRGQLMRRQEILRDRQALVDQRAALLSGHYVKRVEIVEGRLKDNQREMEQNRKAIQEIQQAITNDEERAKDLCYDVLGILAERWCPNTELYEGKTARDWIGKPKPNQYQSLHTTLMIESRMVEVQIRTQAMHNMAEYGAAAAHWRYKATKAYNRGRLTGEVSSKDVEWTAQIAEIRRTLAEDRAALTDPYPRFLENRIFVITPMGDVIDLQAGAGPIDFAYRIHTERGHTFAGAKVNGRIVRNDYELQNGDIVELLPGRGKSPSINWLAMSKDEEGKSRPIFARTTQARRKIRSWLRHHGMLPEASKGHIVNPTEESG
jgi:(p)ppGpp synthase/HD superfamily hydrolase